jgi:hypothetical protein
LRAVDVGEAVFTGQISGGEGLAGPVQDAGIALRARRWLARRNAC